MGTVGMLIVGEKALIHLLFAGIERFYFPEKFKNKLAVVPPQSSVTISLSSSGQAVVKSMQVDDLDLLEWLNQQSE